MNRNLNDVYEKLGSMDSKLDTLLAKGDDHETRIRDLEQSKFKALGMLAVVTVLVSAAWNGLLQWWHGPTPPTQSP